MMNKASKPQLRAEIAALRSIGRQMSNICFNLSQRSGEISPENKSIMRELQQKWDAIRKAE